jgi:hypothetical protein
VVRLSHVAHAALTWRGTDQTPPARVYDRRLVVDPEDAVARPVRDGSVSLRAVIVPALSVTRLRIS